MNDLEQSSSKEPAVAVIGAGPAGLTAAVMLASAGVETVLVAPAQSTTDNRTTALFAGSVTALQTIDVWPRCEAHAAPLRTIRIVDDTGRLLRAPEVRFDAAEIGLDAFGQNIANRDLVAALLARGRELPCLTIVESRVRAVDCAADNVYVHLEDGQTFAAPLAVAADGRTSMARAAAAIDVTKHDYPQAALTVSLSHGRPHNNVSTEFHTGSGPFTLVPLPGQRSSLVWVLSPEDARMIGALDDAALSSEIERRSHSILGKITVDPGRGLFPLSVGTARQFGARRVALIGEAAHVIPPIGAQGLNLGLRDAATIAELVAAAQRAGADSGSEDLLARYDGLRRSDVGTRTLAVDLLNRSLLSDFLPAQGLRGAGLYLVDRIGPLRRAVMREGVAPARGEPRLMRGEAL